MSTPNPTSPAEPTSTPGADPDALAEAVRAALLGHTQAEGHLAAMRPLPAPHDVGLDMPERQRNALKADVQREHDALSQSVAPSMMLRTPGDGRDEVLRRVAEDPDALKNDPLLAIRIDLERARAQRPETDPEVS